MATKRVSFDDFLRAQASINRRLSNLYQQRDRVRFFRHKHPDMGSPPKAPLAGIGVFDAEIQAVEKIYTDMANRLSRAHIEIPLD